MGVKIRKQGNVTASFSTPQEIVISHTNDSIALGDGTNTMSLQDVGGVKSVPVKVTDMPAAAGGSTSANQTNGSQKTQVVDAGGVVAEIDDVAGEKALKVSVISTVGGAGSGTASTDSAGYTAGSSSFTPIGGAYDDVSSDALAEGEMGMVRMTSARAMHVQLQNSSVAVTGTFWQATQPVSAASLPLPSGAATEATLSSLLTSSQLLDDIIATLGSAAPTKGALMAGTDGTNARALKTDASGELQVDVLTLPSIALAASTNNIGDVDVLTLPALPAGTNNIGDVDVLTLPSIPAGTNNIGDVDVLTLPSIPAGNNNIGDVDIASAPTGASAIQVQGNVAHDAAASGSNPQAVGGRAMTANNTAVANGDLTYFAADNQGRQIVTPHAPRDLVTHATGSQATTTEATMLAAGGAGVFHDVTKLIFTNSSSSTAAQVQIRDALAGTIRLEMMIAPNGGAVIDFGSVPMCQTTANGAWTIDLNAAVSTVYWYIQAIKRIA